MLSRVSFDHTTSKANWDNTERPGFKKISRAELGCGGTHVLVPALGRQSQVGLLSLRPARSTESFRTIRALHRETLSGKKKKKRRKLEHEIGIGEGKLERNHKGL